MTPLTELKGIGEKNAGLYLRLGIDSVESAICHFPRDYVTYEDISGPHELCADRIIAFTASLVRRPSVKRVRRLSVVNADLSCGGILITSTWFNMPYLANSLKSGSVYVFRGILSPEGIAAVEASSNVPLAFAYAWTHVESIIKADGRGFSFNVRGGRLPEGWKCSRCVVSDHAIACAAHEAPELAVHMRDMTETISRLRG